MAILDDFTDLPTRPNPSKVSFVNPALRAGGIAAGVLAVVGLVMYVAGASEAMIKSQSGSWLNSLMQFGFMFYFIHMGLKNHRKNDLGGYLSIGRGIGFGTLAGLMVGLLSAVWAYIFMTWIAPDMTEMIRQATMQQMADSGLDEDQIEQQMQIAEKFMTPGVMAIFVTIFSVIFGFVIGLISGAILKKE